MSIAPRWMMAALLSTAPFLPAYGADLSLNGSTTVTVELLQSVTLRVTGAPNSPVILLADVDPGPTTLFGQSLSIGFSAAFQALPLGTLDAGGELVASTPVPVILPILGATIHLTAVVLDPAATFGVDISNPVVVEIGAGRLELAGNSLAAFPHFQFVRAFNQGATVELAIDPNRYPYIVGRTADVYVVAAQTAAQWDSNAALVDVTASGKETLSFVAGSIQANTLLLDNGSLSGAAGADIGVGYDVVVDFNQNGVYDLGDFIDGYGDEAGLYVVHDVTLPGPHAVTEVIYSGGTFLGQDTYYPTNVAGMGKLPLVVVSHGNGHNYQWYDHIGNHLASYGYIVMSHQNNTQPGTLTASTTTLTNTDYLLANQATIAGGVLNGHIDDSRITWIGHSRGGEGVVRAYHRVLTGSYVPANFTAANIKLVSSIAPTDFGGTVETDPHGVNYHLWTGGADSDVNGCASADAVQTFHLLDRAQDIRQSISLHGVGHGDFHDGGGSSVASGPCLVGRANTHTIMRGYLLPLVKHYIDGNIPAADFLWRQWESFRPIGAPTSSCVVVDLMYRQSETGGKFVIDDFQTNTATVLSSSGGAVTGSIANLREGRMDDGDANFTNNVNDNFNSFTQARATDTSRGCVFEFSGPTADLTFEVVPAGQDMRGYRYLSFRAAQASRHPFTTAVLADLTFDVTLRDAAGGSSTIDIGAYGGGIEEPYQRTSCGTGTGWAAEFETIRIRLADFTRDGANLDLAHVVAVSFELGSSHGSNEGRLGLDQIELTVD